MERRTGAEAEERALRVVTEALGLADVRRETSDRGIDIRAKRGAERVVVQVKHLPTLRLDDLLGRLAHAVLLLQRAEVKGKKVVVVSSSHVSPAAIDAAQELMSTHAPDVSWMLVGDNGDMAIHAPSLGVERTRLVQRRKGKALEPRRTTSQLFSDLNAWMLKVLLLRDVDESFWGGPREQVRSATHLAEVAGVSEPHAYRFVRTFEEMDFVRRTDDGLTVVRREALVESWLEATRLTPRKAIHVRWLVGEPTDVADVFHPEHGGIFARHVFEVDVFGQRKLSDAKPRVALAGFEACRVLDLLHTEADERELHVAGNIKELLEQHDLERCAPVDAHFTLLPTKGESVFRGCVEVDDGLLCADALQAALDVVVHPARGREQAEHILQALKWFV